MFDRLERCFLSANNKERRSLSWQWLVPTAALQVEFAQTDQMGPGQTPSLRTNVGSPQRS